MIEAAIKVAESLLTVLSYPSEAIPDGSIAAPHHYLYPLYAILVLSAIKWDNYPKQEPVAVTVSTLIGLFSWFQFWPYYPVLGATLCGLALVAIAISTWKTTLYGRRWQYAIVFLTIMAVDDWLSHALGVWMPLDWIFNEFIYHLLA